GELFERSEREQRDEATGERRENNERRAVPGPVQFCQTQFCRSAALSCGRTVIQDGIYFALLPTLVLHRDRAILRMDSS
ncbi:hypothetical protein KC734_23865, partial [candidate division KSB1 bacterium]|nr:hypothetical protein [candidate division KSB1 bacterium]